MPSGIAISALFVVLWSTGFIGAKLGLPHAESMTFLALRFALVAAVLFIWVAVSGARWLTRA
ncbi:MAG: EamA/RhaT family transporter, partial [Pseudomonadota bacterium]